MNSSDSISNLAASLVKAQGKIEGATKDKTNPHFRSKYADLSSVVEAIKGPASENGLGYTQVLHDGDNAAKVETIIIHASGEWLSCGIIAVPVVKPDAQGYGSALTYARRYSLSAAFGVAPEDDDGNAAAKAAPAWSTANPTNDALKRMSEEQMVKIRKCVSRVFDCLNAYKPDKACEVIDGYKFDADEKVALWTFFDSKQRAALKAAAEKRRDEAKSEVLDAAEEAVGE